MEERTLRVLTLMRVPGFGARRIASLIRADGVDDLYQSPRRFAGQISEDALHCLENKSTRHDAEEIYEQARRMGQEMILLGAGDYPKPLAAIYDPPPVLFVRGSLLSEARRVAIVGSRGATGSGRSMARELARGLATHGLEVVSGLARGIDGSAHEGALLGKGITLAVLGSSLDIIYPGEHVGLAIRIAERGAIISELPPRTRPSPSQFPSRNRIIVGLAEAVVVVEAGARSGALITARVALDEGRDVLAVPGRPGDPLAHGPNLMIRDGAILIRGVEDVLEHLQIASPKKNATSVTDPILQTLAQSNAHTFSQLAVDTGLAPPLLMARLSELELQGRIERLPGTLFRSAGPA